MLYLGEERFQAREIVGYAGIAAHGQEGICVTVIDRAYCAQVMKRWQSDSEQYRRAGRAFARIRIREEAATLAAELNAK